MNSEEIQETTIELQKKIDKILSQIIKKYYLSSLLNAHPQQESLIKDINVRDADGNDMIEREVKKHSLRLLIALRSAGNKIARDMSKPKKETKRWVIEVDKR